MKTIKYKTIIKKDGEINVSGIPCKKGEKVEMILMINSSNLSENNKKMNNFNAIKLKTSGFKFNRDIAHER